MEQAERSLIEKSRRLKRFVSLEEIFYPVSYGVSEEFFSLFEAEARSTEYVIWGVLMSFMMEKFRAKGDQHRFPVDLFVKDDSLRTEAWCSFSHLLKSHPVYDQEFEEIWWDEGFMDDEKTRVTCVSEQKRCCCSSYEADFATSLKYPIRYTAKGSRGHCILNPKRSTEVATKCSAGSLNDEIAKKPSIGDHSNSDFGYHSVRHMRILPRESNMSAAILSEEELLDALLLL